MKRGRKVFINIIKVIQKPEMRVLPGQLAFFFVVSLIPLIALIGTIMSSFSMPVDTLENIVNSSLPNGVAEIFTTLVEGNHMNFNIAVFFVSAFLLASNGTHSIIITSNEIYKIESNNYIRRRLKAIMMTLILVLLLIFLLMVPVFGDSIFEILRITFNETETLDAAYKIYKILKYPISVILVFYNIRLIYTIAPDKKIDKNSTFQGAFFTTISWILATEVYTFYVAKFTNYDVFYGSISNILVLLLWVYLLAYIFVLGMAFNAGNTLDLEGLTKSLKLSKIDKKR